MKLNEYLEKLGADSYKREIDQEENVVRSLPFAATFLVLLASVLAFIADYIPLPALTPVPVAASS
jgi:hypothetical protein